jgi:hypothetical protein
VGHSGWCGLYGKDLRTQAGADRSTINDRMTDASMIPLAMVVGHEFGDDASPVSLP